MAFRANVTDEITLRKKLLEIHAHDGSSFDTESVIASIEEIIDFGMSQSNAISDGPNQVDKPLVCRIIAPSGHDGIHDTLPYLLHKITCVLNCTCSGGDDHASAIEILQLLANYSWQAKIVIVLASFIVEYAQYNLVAMLYKSHSLAQLVANLKQIPDHSSEEISNVIKSKFENIINQVKLSIQVTSIIAKFGSLPSKHISNDAQPLVQALNQIPLAVYWMTRIVIACSSVHSEILGKTQVTSSDTETNITTIEKRITTIHTTLKKQLDDCNVHIEEKKQFKYVEKLKVMFQQSTSHQDNQKILQFIINNTKDGPRPLTCGENETTLGVDVLKGKEVLLLVSNLEISHEEVTKITQFYQESRTQSKYEIVWFPIVENYIQQSEKFEEKYREWKCKMPWYALEKLEHVKSGFVKYVKQEWKYSKKSIMVSLDQRGSVVHPNAFHMMWTWGNSVTPFTHKRKSDLWKIKQWSLKLLVENIEVEIYQQISTWMSEERVICLYGGDDYEWINEFVTKTSQIVTKEDLKLEMVYVCKKNIKQDHITKVKEIHNGRGHVWESTTSTYFWKRIECMMYSKVHHGAKVAPEKEASDPILAEVLNMLALGDSESGWALISQGAGLELGKIARANGDVIRKAFSEFEEWGVQVKENGFAIALNNYISGHVTVDHHCSKLVLPGLEDNPGVVFCAECRRPMEKYIMYRCCTD